MNDHSGMKYLRFALSLREMRVFDNKNKQTHFLF